MHTCLKRQDQRLRGINIYNPLLPPQVMLPEHAAVGLQEAAMLWTLNGADATGAQPGTHSTRHANTCMPIFPDSPHALPRQWCACTGSSGTMAACVCCSRCSRSCAPGHPEHALSTPNAPVDRDRRACACVSRADGVAVGGTLAPRCVRCQFQSRAFKPPCIHLASEGDSLPATPSMVPCARLFVVLNSTSLFPSRPPPNANSPGSS